MKDKSNLKFAALDPFITTNIIKPTETVLRHQDFVEFGERNEYPNYIYSLYNECNTLHSIINGTIDFVCGDKIINNTELRDNEIENFVYDLALNILIFGGAYIEVLRNKIGKVVKMNVLNFRNVRTNEDNTKFYYSKGFSENKTYGRCKCTVYDKFDRDDKAQSQSILLVKNIRTNVYPIPLWNAATISAEIDKNVNNFHLNNLSNGFTAATVVNFNNGVPEDEIKEEIEKAFNEKFCGTQNAGRFMLSWNDDKDHAVNIESLDMNNFGEQYTALAERAREELFIAFRATPNLFGLPTQTTGFNQQEYDAAFKLYNKTIVKPIQKTIIRTLEDITDVENCVEIEQFKIDFDA